MHELILQFGEKQIIGCVTQNKEKVAIDIVDTSGIARGIITDLYKFTKNVYELIKKLESCTKVKLQDAVVLLPSEQIKIIYLSTQIKPKGKFRIDHMKKMILQLKKTCSQNNLYLLKCKPYAIILDGQKVENPVGMESSLCRITWNVFCVQSYVINNFKNAFADLYINISDYSLQDYEMLDFILHEDDKKLGSTVLNIKEDNTIIYSIKNNLLVKVSDISLGYSTIDNETAVRLNVSIQHAQHLRKKYCRGIASESDKNHHIKLKKRNLSEGSISHYEFINTTVPIIKKFISQLTNKIGDNINSKDRLFLMGEFAEIHGLDLVFNRYFEHGVYLLNKANIDNMNTDHDMSFLSIDGYIRKMKIIPKKINSLNKFFQYILLGLKKIYDMINK